MPQVTPTDSPGSQERLRAPGHPHRQSWVTGKPASPTSPPQTVLGSQESLRAPGPPTDTQSWVTETIWLAPQGQLV